MVKTYFTHSNGGRPFKIVIKNKDIYVYKYTGFVNNNNIYSKKEILYLKNVKKIFIGKSKYMSNTFDSYFDGNSILVNIKNNEYVFIGNKIFKFNSFFEIVNYKSPVGNSDVPYPYGIDKNNNYYLMIEDVVINTKLKINEDPYDYYYNLKRNIEPKEINKKKIKGFYIGNNKYNFSYSSRPHNEYDRIAKWDDFGKGMKFKLEKNKEYKIDRKEYIKIMKKIGKDNNIKHFKGLKMIHKKI